MASVGHNSVLENTHNGHRHNNVIRRKHFPCYWPFVRGIHWSLVDSPHKGQWCRALMFSLMCTWTNAWTNMGIACDLSSHVVHVTSLLCQSSPRHIFFIWCLFYVDSPTHVLPGQMLNYWKTLIPPLIHEHELENYNFHYNIIMYATITQHVNVIFNYYQYKS